MDEILEVLNKIQRNLGFTMEIENDRELPFLDLRIIKRGKGITFDIDRKPALHTAKFEPLPSIYIVLFLAKIYRLFSGVRNGLQPSMTESVMKKKAKLQEVRWASLVSSMKLNGRIGATHCRFVEA